MLYPAKDNTNQPLDWDENKEYTATNVEVWIQENMVLPYPSEGSADIESLRHHYQPQVRRTNEVNNGYRDGFG